MRKRSDAEVGLDMLVGLSAPLQFSLKRSLCRLLVSPIYIYIYILFVTAFSLNHVNKA